MLQSDWVTVADGRLYLRCTTVARSVPVVLVHGWGVSGRYFVPLAERLAADFTVYIPDLPGHGRSESPPRPLAVPGLAAALLDGLAALQIERAVLVGHSLGCQTVVEAALRQPQRVARLVLLGPVPDAAARSAAVQLVRLLRCVPYERLALVGLVARDYLRMGWRLLPEFRAMLAYPLAARLTQLTLPVLLVSGERDALVPPRWRADIARHLGQVQVVVLPGAGHAVNYSAPDRLVTALRPFLHQATAQPAVAPARPAQSV